jgi:hypothetical protein
MDIPDLKLEISASVVAWYAAIVATVSCIISFYVSYRDRAKILIKYRRDMMVRGVETYDPDKTYFNITVINRGRRPVNIISASFRIFKSSKNKYAYLSDSLAVHRNKILTESNPSSEFFVVQDELLLKYAGCIYVKDATGRTYRKFMKPILLVFCWRIFEFIYRK